MIRIGGLVLIMVRTCTGLVWVRSSVRSPSSRGSKKKVSCISRAGCFGGKFNAVKLWKSSSMSGPSATAKPISAKIAASSSNTCMVGCTEPLRRTGAGRVKSTRSARSCASSALASSPALRSLIRPATRSRRPLMAGPWVLRSSGLIAPSDFSRLEIEPVLPRAATRTASSAARSAAAPTWALSSASRVERSVMVLVWSVSSDQQKALRLGPEGSCKQAGPRTQGLSSQRGANLVGDGLERSRVGARDIGEDLAVHVDASHVQAVDKLRVGEAFQARRGVDALDPQGAEHALADLAVAVGVLAGLVHRGLGRADGVLAAAVEALGLFQDLLVLGVGGDAPFDASHVSAPS